MSAGIRYCDTLQKFSVSILYDNTIYVYDLAIDALGIHSESLAREGVKRKSFFCVKRREEGIDYNGSIFRDETKGIPTIKLHYDIQTGDSASETVSAFDRTLKNDKAPGLFVTKFALLGLDPAVHFCSWMNDTLCVESAPYGAYEIQRGEQLDFDDLRIMESETFLTILRMIDPSIESIKLDQKTPYLNTIIRRRSCNGRLYERELMNDSAGVRDYFAWAV